MELIPRLTQKYDLGRVAIFRRPVWAGTTNFFEEEDSSDIPVLAHIGNTEGDVNPDANPEFSDLKLPESTGPAIIKRYLSGENPSFDIGIFPSLAGLKLFSPAGTASAGFEFRQLVKEHALWLVSEQLFLKADATTGRVGAVEVVYQDAGTFLKDGEALDTDDQALVDQSLIIWRATFGRATPVFHHDDGGRQLKQVPVQVMQDFDRPNGCQLYLVVGELSEFEDLNNLIGS